MHLSTTFLRIYPYHDLSTSPRHLAAEVYLSLPMFYGHMLHVKSGVMYYLL